MGFSPNDMGITTEEAEACLKGLLKVGHKFNEHDIPTGGAENTKPHCVLIVVNAEELDRRTPREWSSDNCIDFIKIVPEDVARLIVITKVDRVCSDSSKNIELIFTSKKVETLVQKAKGIFGVQGNHVFPIINFVDEKEVNEEKSVPIMFLLKYAFNFAKDRKEKYMN